MARPRYEPDDATLHAVATLTAAGLAKHTVSLRIGISLHVLDRVLKHPDFAALVREKDAAIQLLMTGSAGA